MAVQKNYDGILLLMMVVATLAHGAASRTLSGVTMVSKHEQWMARHGRTYASKEEKEARFKIFRDNVEFIDNFNRAANATYKLGINQFADLTSEEFLASHASGYKMPDLSSHSESLASTSFLYENVSLTEVEPSLDWRARGAVTPVKSQDPCGDCWIFAAVAAIEGINKIKTGKLVSLSEQEIRDCMGEPNMCDRGGASPQAFSFVANYGGLVSDSEYPYIQSKQEEACRVPRGYPSLAARISTYENVPANDEAALLKAVSNQPVSVAIDARAITYYHSGVVSGYYGATPSSLNHEVTIVGYGTSEQGYKYWLVKNSWASTWGENGYLKIQRDSGAYGGMLGIAFLPSYPVIN